MMQVLMALVREKRLMRPRPPRRRRIADASPLERSEEDGSRVEVEFRDMKFKIFLGLTSLGLTSLREEISGSR